MRTFYYDDIAAFIVDLVKNVYNLSGLRVSTCCGCWKVIGSYIYRAKFPCAVMFCISVKILLSFVLWCFTECFINRLVSRVQLKVTHI